MDFSKKCGSLALGAAILAFSGCKSAKELFSFNFAPPSPPEETSCAVASCSVTCPNPDIQPIIDSEAMSTEEKKTLLANRINDITMIDAHNSLGGKSPSYSNKDSFFLMGDFLYWKAQEDGLEYAANMIPLDTTGRSYKERPIGPHFTYNMGFRVGAGYRLAGNESWDIDLIYTWFYTKAKNSVSNPTTGLMYPTWGGPAFADPESFASAVPNSLVTTIVYASSEWGLHYNVGDFELGRHYFVSKAVSLRPSIGVRGTSIDQDYSVHYLQSFIFVLNDLVTTQQEPASMFAGSKFHGIGPRLKLDLEWHLNCHWSVLGQLSGSLLYGPFKTHQTYNTHILTISGSPISPVADVANFPNLIFSEKNNFNRFATNLEATLGLKWTVKHFSLGVFYELSEWFRQNRFTRSTAWINGEFTLHQIAEPGIFSQPYVKEHGNLGLSGLTVKGRLEF